MTEALAALAAVAFGGSAVGARLGLRDTGIVAGVLIANAAAALILIVAAVIDPPPSTALHPTAWFALSGLVGGPGLASAAVLLGLLRLGPPTHVPLQGGAYGIVVSLGAALFLSEAIGLPKAVGVAAVIVGAGSLVRAQARAEAQPEAQLVSAVPVAGRGVAIRNSPSRQVLRWTPKGWYFPPLAGAMLASGDLIAKWELRTFPYPTYAAAVAMTVGTLAWGLATFAVPALRAHLHAGRHARWFLVVGASLGVGFAALNTALNRGDASTVGPIVASEPLAAILLSALFLSTLHRVTWPMVLAGGLVVVGTVLVSI